MIGTPAHPPTLPTWVAGYRFTVVPGQRSPHADASPIGAFDVLRPDAGAEFCHFGSPALQSTVLFDGFLFDRPELCEQLGLSRNASCAQVAAAAYEKWGADCLARLAGNYLVAIADRRSQRLLLGHDPLGRHPVFYAASGDVIWFASNVLALGGSGAVSNRANRLSLALAVMTLWPAAGQTFFAEIKRLRPGHRLEINHAGDVRELKYWDPLPESEDDWLSEREVHQSFEPELIRAVDRCMTLAPDGIMLSGGVDSVTIAALAHRYTQTHGRPPIVALSGRPDVPLLQEEFMQTLAAESIGLPHIVTHLSEWTGRRNDIEMSLEMTPSLPGPSRIYWVGTYTGFYRVAVANNLRVLLTGSGGDNWLSVDDAHAADLIRRLKLIQLWRFVQASSDTGGSDFRVAFRRLAWGGGLRLLVDSVAAKLLPTTKARFHRSRVEAIIPTWLCPDLELRRALIEHYQERRTPGLDARGRMPRNYYQHAVAANEHSYLPYEFETAAHVEAMCGVRLLSPYHDATLVRFFTHIPPPVLVHGNKYKGLLRPVVEKYVPGRGFGNQRKDYPAQAEELDLQKLRDGVRQAWPAFSFEHLTDLGVVEPRMREEEAANAATHRFNALVRMFALMSAEIWTGAHTG